MQQGFDAKFTNTDVFTSFKYKAKLLGNTMADWANGILTNATFAVLLKYLSNFWISFEIAQLNKNLNGHSIVLYLRLIMTPMIPILKMLFLLSKTQS